MHLTGEIEMSNGRFKGNNNQAHSQGKVQPSNFVFKKEGLTKKTEEAEQQTKEVNERTSTSFLTLSLETAVYKKEATVAPKVINNLNRSIDSIVQVAHEEFFPKMESVSASIKIKPLKVKATSPAAVQKNNDSAAAKKQGTPDAPTAIFTFEDDLDASILSTTVKVTTIGNKKLSKSSQGLKTKEYEPKTDFSTNPNRFAFSQPVPIPVSRTMSAELAYKRR